MKACVNPQPLYFYDTPKQNHVRVLDQSLSIRPCISVSFSLCPYRSVVAPYEIGRMTCTRPHSPIVSSHWAARAVTTRQENKLLRQCCKHRRKTGKGQQCAIAQELQTGRRTHANTIAIQRHRWSDAHAIKAPPEAMLQHIQPLIT